MKIKFKKLHPNSKLPSHSKKGDAGLDLTITEIEVMTDRLSRHRYGISVEIPEGHVGLLFPRSSICKHKGRLTNSVGVIDSSYRGEIMAVFDMLGSSGDSYMVGDRSAQLVIVPYLITQTEWSDELGDTERGFGGYGSTGK